MRAERPLGTVLVAYCQSYPAILLRTVWLYRTFAPFLALGSTVFTHFCGSCDQSSKNRRILGAYNFRERYVMFINGDGIDFLLGKRDAHESAGFGDVRQVAIVGPASIT